MYNTDLQLCAYITSVTKTLHQKTNKSISKIRRITKTSTRKSFFLSRRSHSEKEIQVPSTVPLQFCNLVQRYSRTNSSNLSHSFILFQISFTNDNNTLFRTIFVLRRFCFEQVELSSLNRPTAEPSKLPGTRPFEWLCLSQMSFLFGQWPNRPS